MKQLVSLHLSFHVAARPFVKLAVGVIVVFAVSSAPFAQPPRHVPAETRAVWKKAGGDTGWFRRTWAGRPYFIEELDDGKPGDLPAFSFVDRRRGSFTSCQRPRFRSPSISTR